MSEDMLPRALKTLKQTINIQECVIVNTCNRMEIYTVVDSQMCGRYIYEFVERWFGLSYEQFFKHLYMHEDQEAIRHLLRVTSGLDSMVVGETQILGQVRNAFLLAQKMETTGPIFNSLFRRAVTFAKRAHTETKINENPVSISYAAVEMGKFILGGYTGKSVMIIGAGKMSELTLKHLCAHGADQLTIVNRTFERAVELASHFAGQASDFTRLTELMEQSDVVISSTGAQDMIMTADQMELIMRKRPERPLFLIDIAVPRDFDPQIKSIPNVFLYDIDELESIVENNLQDRQKEVDKIEKMIGLEIEQFEQWHRTIEVAPMIQALQLKANTIHEHTMQDLANKLPDLSAREMKLIRKLSKSIVNQIVRDPILQIKDLSTGRDRDRAIELFTRFFALEPWLQHNDESSEEPNNILSAMGLGR